MDKNEIICISSDDEDNFKELSTKSNRSPSRKEADTKDYIVNTNINQQCNDEKKEVNKQKRKISEVNGISCQIDKKLKMELSEEETEDQTRINVKENEIKLQKDTSVPLVNNSVKPQLIIKEKKTISSSEQDVFPRFISLCLQKKREPAMETIVNKLKRRYEQMDPSCAKSDDFKNFLNSKRDDISDSDHMIYQHIMEVMIEMKSKAASKVAALAKASRDNIYKSQVSSDSPSTSNLNNSENVDNNEEDYTEITMDSSKERKLKKIVKVMEICTKKIKKLEEAEVDFDDEGNSNYIKLEKYKDRMVKLYAEYCNLTGDNVDAGRPYLRPKHLNTTQIVSVDQAITNFINAKITKRNQLKSNGGFTDDLIFPDYRDILKCVSNCNDKNNLGLDKRKQFQIAKKAFVDLGDYLQRARRNDYWDTFSLFLENQPDDPALKNSELADKLHKNRMLGDQKLAQVFQEYVKKQEELRDLSIQDKTNTENDEDNVESNDEDENSKEYDEENEDEEENDDIEAEGDNEEDTESNNNGIQSEEDNKNEDISKSSSISNTKNGMTEHEDNSKESLTRVCDHSNGDRVTSNTPKITCDEVQSKNTTISPENVSKESNPTTKLETVIVQPLSISNNNSTTNDIEDEIVKITSSENESDARIDESKPLLRVRSFAKPPTTWDDDKQKSQTAGETAIKEVIDLTTEIPKTNKEVSKLSIQIGKRVVPLKSTYKTVVIPANLRGKNIINVKNITNNYVKLNTSDIRTNTSSNSEANKVVKSLPSVRQVLDVSSVNTIIHVPHVSNKQNLSSSAKNSEMKPKQTILRLIRPKQVQQNNYAELPITGTSQKKEK